MHIYEKYDDLILDRINNNYYKFEPSLNKLFILNPFRKVGCYCARYDCDTVSLKVGNSFKHYPVYRIIWIMYYGRIPKNKIVVKNNSEDINILNNLKLVDFTSKNKLSFTQEEIDYIKQNYKTKSDLEMSKRINRSDKAIRQKLTNLRLSRSEPSKEWTEEEDKILTEMYVDKHISIKDIEQKLKRTKSSIMLRANRNLNLKRPYKQHLSTKISEKTFYTSLRDQLQVKNSKAFCCICDYSTTIDLHHIDGNNKNHHVSNIATLCPNHHREVEMGLHPNQTLFAIWCRIYPDGQMTDRITNSDKKLNFTLENV